MSMENQLNKNGLDDDILFIVKGFVDYFEQASKSLQLKEDEKDDNSIKHRTSK